MSKSRWLNLFAGSFVLAITVYELLTPPIDPRTIALNVFLFMLNLGLFTVRE